VGKAHQPQPVKLLIGLLAKTPLLLGQATERLQDAFGAIDATSEPVPFVHTRYYAKELGDNPWRQFLTFLPLVDPGELAAIKLRTNAIELEWAENGLRQVNIDPGYIALGKLVLATTKDYWHRVYLGRGIYAEVTLPFRGGAFQPQEWTYADYRTPDHLRFFTQARERYRAQLPSLSLHREREG
jgi:hypothetical protein